MPKTNHLTPLGGYSDAGAKKLRQMAENAAVLTEFLRFQGDRIVKEFLQEIDPGDAAAAQHDPLFFFGIRAAGREFLVRRTEQDVILRGRALHRHELLPG